MRKRARALALIAQDLNRYTRDRRITQAMLAARVGVSQSHVSRLLNGKARRLSRCVLIVCRYADIPVYETKVVDPRKNRILIEALRKVWDGTDEHARSIARVIASLERFGRLRR